MQTLVIILVLVTVVNQLASARDSSLTNDWIRYKKQHGKVYKTSEEDAHRFSLFMSAKSTIERHNSANYSYKLGLNHLSDWTRAELARLNGLLREHSTPDRQSVGANEFLQRLKEDDTPVPKELDWRSMPNRVSSVKDQGGCGSCWAFATVGILEGQQVVRNFTKELVDLSAQDLVDCSGLNQGCAGGLEWRALKDITRVGGIDSEHDYPYTQEDSEACRFNRSKSVMKNDGYQYLKDLSEILLQKLVAQYGPVAIGVIGDYWSDYKSGVFDSDTCIGDIDHAVLLVGYGTDPKLGDYWLIKNSWNVKWGEKGYIRLRRGEQMCGIGSQVTIATWK